MKLHNQATEFLPITNKIAINKAHYPVTVLGYGKRIGIWFQGCDIRCAGCVSQDTWEDDNGKVMPINTLVEWCKKVSGGNLDGITITGGEPFYQLEALTCLLTHLHKWRNESGITFDILCYSGHTFDYLSKHHQKILPFLDVIVPEPYNADLSKSNQLYGSANQQVVIISPLGAERYGEHLPSDMRTKMQVSAKDGKLWFIGIPDRGDMERVNEICASKGLNLKGNSWRT